MTTALDVTELTQGAGTLYAAPYGEAEPAVTSPLPAPAGNWEDVGITVGGVAWRYSPEYADLAADQLIDTPAVRLTGRSNIIVTQMAQAVLENLDRAISGLVSDTGTGTTIRELGFVGTAAVTNPTKLALILDGTSAEGKARRIIVRRAYQRANFDLAYSKDGQTIVPVEFHALFDTTSISPVKIVDED